MLVVYEDFAAGRRAVETCNFLIAQLGDAVECRTAMWKFDLLRNPKLQYIAAVDAAEADVVVIATPRTDDLPEELKSWFELWVPRRESHAAALVALLNGHGERGASPAYACLKALAARAGMDFLPHQALVLEPAVRQAEPGLSDTPATGTQIKTEATPVQHWGLNE